MAVSSYTPKGITPLPWAIGQSATKVAICEASVVGSDRMEHPVCVISMLDKLDARDVANAKYLVHSANKYPKAIEALRNVLSLYRANASTFDPIANVAINEAESVLAAAREMEAK